MEFLVRVQTFQKRIEAESFRDLKSKIKRTFKFIVPKQFRISYLDSEADQVTLADNGDYEVLQQSDPIQPIEIIIQGSEEPPSEEDSSDEMKRSISNSIKAIRELQESVHKRKGSSVTSTNNERTTKNTYEPQIIEDDTEHLSESVSDKTLSRIEHYKQNIQKLEGELKERKPVPLAQCEGFQRFVEDLEKSELSLWECQDGLQFKNQQINFLSMADEFMILLKQRAKEIDMQWKKQIAKQKFIKKYNEKIKRKQQQLQPELKNFYQQEITDKAYMVSHILNLPLNESLFNFVQAYGNKEMDELVLEALENRSLL